MFCRSIVESDRFLEMPLTSQALYFHLGLRADDEGFINSPKRILREINCSIDDLKLLISKGFVYCFESGIVVITHWKVHNTIKTDRFTPSIYSQEKKLLSTDNNKKYVLLSENNKIIPNIRNTMEPNWNQIGTKLEPQYRLDKNRLDKDSNNIQSTSVDGVNGINYQNVLNSFNSICVSLPKVKKLTAERKRKIKNLKKNLDNLTFDDYFTMIEQSDFLTGRNGVWNNCNFDWCMKPTNCIKIIEGNYKNKEKVVQSNLPNYEEEF